MNCVTVSLWLVLATTSSHWPQCLCNNTIMQPRHRHSPHASTKTSLCSAATWLAVQNGSKKRPQPTGMYPLLPEGVSAAIQHNCCCPVCAVPHALVCLLSVFVYTTVDPLARYSITVFFELLPRSVYVSSWHGQGRKPTPSLVITCLHADVPVPAGVDHNVHHVVPIVTQRQYCHATCICLVCNSNSCIYLHGAEPQQKLGGFEHLLEYKHSLELVSCVPR
jgi:hypothetical protein